MAVQPGLKLHVKPHPSVEWTTKLPEIDDYSESPEFTAGNNQCYLLIHNVTPGETGYALCLVTLSEPCVPFEVTVFFSRVTDQLPVAKTKVIHHKGCHLIWEYFDMRNDGFEKSGHGTTMWNFWVVMHACSQEMPEYCPDHLTYEEEEDTLTSLSQDMLHLLEDSSDHDVKIRCQGKVLSAHRNILSARSQVFKAMLKTDKRENQASLIDVQDMVFPALQHILRYLYTGMIPDMTVNQALELYKGADKYEVDSLKYTCLDFLIGRLENPNHACRILMLADKHGYDDLKKAVISCMANDEVPKRWDGWRDFCNDHQKLAIEVLNHYAFRK